MQNKEEITDPEIQAILEDGTMSEDDKILKLKKMYIDELALQRMASEAPIEGDDVSGQRIQHLTNALNALDVDLSSFEENAATL